MCAAALAQQPRIDRISPSEGPIAGGTIVTIAGANFTAGAVMLDRTAISPLSQSDSELRLNMPAHDNGYGILIVKNGTGSAYARYLYVPPPLRDLAPAERTDRPAERRHQFPACRTAPAMARSSSSVNR